MTTPMCGNRRGFTLIEILTVVVLIGVLMAIVMPRFRVSQVTKAQAAADLLARDLEALRSRALSTRSIARLVVDPVTSTYVGYLDDDRDGTIVQTAAENAALQVFRTRALDPDVRIGRVGVPDLPGFAGAGSITLPNGRVDFDARGLTTPLGTQGVLYLSGATDQAAVAAVSVSAAAGIQTWVYRNGAWQ